MNVVRETDSMPGELLLNEPMSRHTSWRVGGPAERYFRPAGLEGLCTYLRQLPQDEPVTWVGLGSNLLVRDGGIRGTVIATSGMLNGLSVIGDNLVRAEAGVASAKVARFTVNEGLHGAEFLAGIPGTIGGALAMNAGAFGGETWDIVAAVETIDHHGTVHTRTPDEFTVGYRHVQGTQGEWFIAAHFRLSGQAQGDGGTDKIKSLLARRGATQPMQTANAGSVFTNPPGDHAARLIEQCGLKGRCHGKACVSEIHANFIINTGGASAADIEQLIRIVQQEVNDQTGIELQPEVRIIGDTE